MASVSLLGLLLMWLTFSFGDDHKQLIILQRDFTYWREAERAQPDRQEQFNFGVFTSRELKAKEFLQTLLSIDKEALSKRDQTDYTIMENMLETFIEGYQWRNWNYLTPVTWLEGPQRDPFFQVYGQFYFETRGDFENYIVSLGEMPRLFREVRAFNDEAIRLDRAAHIKSVDRVPGQIEEILKVPVEHSIYYQPFVEELERYNITSENPEQVRSEIRHRGLEAVKVVYKAYEDLKEYIETTYMDNTRSSAGFGALENGGEFYKACLNWYLSLNMTPEDIHDLGLMEVNRVRAKMEEIIKKQGHEGHTIRDYFTELKQNKDMFFQTEAEIIQEFLDIINYRIEPVLNKLFKDQPGLPITVRPMPHDGSRGSYFFGSSDGTIPGTFHVNTHREIPKYTMVSLAMHESNPGHHLQLSYEHTSGVSEFRKHTFDAGKFRVPFSFPLYTAFAEGWALYAESLGVEAGIYVKDYDVMGYYESEIFRAARLVVDTGLHYFNWTRQEAIDYFMENTAETLSGVEVEVDRYITWPGQAVAYKVGELHIRALRQQAEEELGSNFDIREFHMAILQNGAVPLKVLEKEFADWLDAEKKKHRDREQNTKLETHRATQDSEEECECVEDATVGSRQAYTTPATSFRGTLRCRMSSLSPDGNVVLEDLKDNSVFVGGHNAGESLNALTLLVLFNVMLLRIIFV